MESSRSFTNFSQLRNALDHSIPQQDDRREAPSSAAVAATSAFSPAFGQSKEFPTALAHNYGGQNRRSMRMDELVQDLNSALDESTSGLRPKRKVWRRRCKSTSNLAAIINSSSRSTVVQGKSQNNSIDETSTSSEEEEMVEEHPETTGQIGISGGDKGTSSLQLSDSDETCSMNNLSSNPVDRRVDNQTTSRRLTPHYSSTVRKKRASSLMEKGKEPLELMSTNEPVSTGQKRDRYVAELHSVTPEKSKNAALESDSLNENLSPLRPNTKRKRKCKRIALDPETAASVCLKDKRKKIRSRSACAQPSTPRDFFPSQPPSLLVTGKRKRSNREKSVETERGVNTERLIKPMDCDVMEIESKLKNSSSSLSSSDWEDASDDERVSQPELDAHEADDEQSDWPGHNEDGGSSTIYGPSDDELIDEENLNSLTETAKQAYLARMRRLAECVPGREIRAGARRLRTRQRAFTIKSASSEQVARFLQDSRRTELRLTVFRPSDRSKIAHLAAMYSLSLRNEGVSANNQGSYIVLTKTGRTLRVNEEFIVPSAPSTLTPPSGGGLEVKRRRREILSDSNPTGETIEFVSMSPREESLPSPTTSTSTNEPPESPAIPTTSYNEMD